MPSIRLKFMKIGDRVEALDDAVKGVVIAIANELVTLRTDDGFDFQYAESELVVNTKIILDHDLDPDSEMLFLKEKTDKNPVKRPKAQKKQRQVPPMEVDLHIDKLVNRTSGLTNYDMMSLQLETAKRQIEFAISKRIQRLVFIHGIGAGVLRIELEHLFKRYDHLKYYDADYRQYGQGAVEVYLPQAMFG